MDAWYRIDLIPGECLVKLSMGGFFDAPAIEGLRVTLVEKLTRLACPPNQHILLCDITAMNIQSQDAVARFTHLVGHPSVRSRQLAFVTGATLARLQARRLTDREGVAFFSDETEALAWLTA